MSKVSKTARASSVTIEKEKKVIPDAELIRLLRIDCASNIYPSWQGTHALLRVYDEALQGVSNLNATLASLIAEKDAALALLNRNLQGRKDEGGYKDLDDAIRQLLQAFIINRDLVKELTKEQMPEVDPGLTASQGQDSIGG